MQTQTQTQVLVTSWLSVWDYRVVK